MTDLERKKAEFHAALRRYQEAEAKAPCVFASMVVGSIVGIAAAELLMWAAS